MMPGFLEGFLEGFLRDSSGSGIATDRHGEEPPALDAGREVGGGGRRGEEEGGRGRGRGRGRRRVAFNPDGLMAFLGKK